MKYDDIHHMFGLSYSSYLVLTRSILEAMPKDWQDKFVRLMQALEDRWPEDAPSQFWVRASKDNKFYSDPYRNYRHAQVKLKEVKHEEEN